MITFSFFLFERKWYDHLLWTYDNNLKIKRLTDYFDEIALQQRHCLFLCEKLCNFLCFLRLQWKSVLSYHVNNPWLHDALTAELDSCFSSTWNSESVWSSSNSGDMLPRNRLLSSKLHQELKDDSISFENVYQQA